MNIRTQLRTLATASMVALAVVVVPAGLAHAAPNVVKMGCEAAGYTWSDTLGCANKSCPDGGLPGDDRQVRTTGGQFVALYMCNGFTGQWDKIVGAEASQSGSGAPLTGSTIDPTGTTSSGPVAPRATTSSR
jgi:hypothetical protein